MQPERWSNGDPKIAPQMCLRCGYNFDAVTSLGKETRMPEPGNITLCMNCGALAFLNDKLRLRPPTTAELADPEIQTFIEAGKRAATLARGVDIRKEGRA